MNITLLFISLTVLSWLFFDVIIIAKKGKQESISAHIIRLSTRPLIPFLVGFLCGHLFWKMKDADIYKDICKQSNEEKIEIKWQK